MTTFEIALVCHKVADLVPLRPTSTVQTTVMGTTKKAHGRSQAAEIRRHVLPFARKRLGAMAAITGATVSHAYYM